MKILSILLLSLFSVTLYAQETNAGFDGHKWEAPYSFPVPKDWTIERFLIPISFAPGILYRGVEDIRFTPGWGNVKSDDYWSYAFLWYLEGPIKINAAIIDSNLKTYYTGLIAVNGRNIDAGKSIPVVTAFKEVQKEKGDSKTFAGTITMLDYMQQKPITLHCKTHIRSCPGKNNTFICCQLSPQPLEHTIWQSLDQLWLDFKCDKDH
jgi:hypothetical protein